MTREGHHLLLDVMLDSKDVYIRRPGTGRVNKGMILSIGVIMSRVVVSNNVVVSVATESIKLRKEAVE